MIKQESILKWRKNNKPYFFDSYKNELITLAKKTSNYETIQNIMRQRYPDINKKAINFERHHISKKLKDWGIKKLDYIKPKTAKDPPFGVDLYDIPQLMSTDTGQIIIGSMLGDGMIHKKYDYFSLTHAKKQKKYLLEKSKRLPFPMKLELKHSTRQTKIMGTLCQEQETWSMRSRKHPFLSKIKEYFYKDNKKIISLDYLKHLNVLGLFIWLYDDGSLRYRPHIQSTEMNICADQNNKESLGKARDILIKNFNLDKISIRNSCFFFNRKSQKRLCDLFFKNIPYELLSSIPYKYTALMEIKQSFTTSGKPVFFSSGGDAR